MSTPSSPPLSLPDTPALVINSKQALFLNSDGELKTLPLDQARTTLDKTNPILCHGRLLAEKIGVKPFPAFDVLELFAFVHPARFVLPTIKGLAETLGLPIPGTLEREAESLFKIMETLLDDLVRHPSAEALSTAWPMSKAGWAWGPFVLAALSAGETTHSKNIYDGLKAWRGLTEWEETPPAAPPGNHHVNPLEARNRLLQLRGSSAEERPQQLRYAASAAGAFDQRDKTDEPHVVLSEAGTGVGKTLGYISAASLWAEKNEAPVWISTFTRNLQRQLDTELDRLHPDETEKFNRVVLRKGRENYICLLNFEEALGRHARPGDTGVIALGLVARWLGHTRFGDMIGGDFPAWLIYLLGRNLTIDLTDKRGECVYSACSHYCTCFIEHTQRRAKTADIVVANHALVMIQAALGNEDEGTLPLRYVFDEGHHIFNAADSAFAAHLSGRETSELRRWLRGTESGSRSRSRGLKARLEDLIVDDDKAKTALDDLLHSASALPGTAWSERLTGGIPSGPTETFLKQVREQVYARDPDPKSSYDLECGTMPAIPGLLDAAGQLESALVRILKSVRALMERLGKRLADEGESLESGERTRIQQVLNSLERRCFMQVSSWRDMLKSLNRETPPEFCDWFAVERAYGRDSDIGFFRHWIDPGKPFAETVLKPSHGTLITSATLTDRLSEADSGPVTDWIPAHQRTGSDHLTRPPLRAEEPSPFDYKANTRIYIVTDINRNSPDQIAGAYRDLMLASGGGGLGLFTAISRLAEVYQRIVADMENADIRLLAQHLDAMDTGTLVDIFRAEENACLLGTDAVRDGVDVPGEALRLIVFDRVPWPRPDILHKARRQHFGGRAYDETLTRMKLRQAFGRLIRRHDDKGVFVMLDRAMPTRLTTAFPEGVEIRRLGLAETIRETRHFLAANNERKAS